MKRILALIIILFGYSTSQAQDKIKVAINSSSTFIETYNKSSFSEDFIIEDAYRLGTTSLTTLREGVNTSLKWIELNITHNKTFQKEICRFKTMEKESFKFHGYVDEFATEMAMIFYGNSDGSFKIVIKQYNSYSEFIIFTDLYKLIGFKNLLDGNSANNEIDDIFTR